MSGKPQTSRKMSLTGGGTANALLLPSTHLSPNSASVHNQRRRASYADPSSLQIFQGMMTPAYPPPHPSPHFLDPSSAAVTGFHRRQLPPTPNTAQAPCRTIPTETGEVYIPMRRGSSPRVLPTPPPLSPPAVSQGAPHPRQQPYSRGSSKDSVHSPPPAENQGNVILERRPSTGRRLPPEPGQCPPPGHISAPDTERSTPNVIPNGHLHRSASTRNPSPHHHVTHNVNNNARHQLPPTPQPNATEANCHRLARLSTSSCGGSSITATDQHHPDGPLSAKVSTAGPPPLIVKRPSQPSSYDNQRITLPTPPVLQAPSSAPQTPRNRLDDGSASAGVYIPQRKFSDAFENKAAADAAISRNGSMAYLLEQQHILRREFTSTPDSAVTVNTATRSNSSSLSPSIEQLNCAGSKSGSDVDGEASSMSTTAAASCMDARVHGLDPALYGGAGVTSCSLSSASSYSVPDSGAPQTGAGPVTASSSWQNVENEPRPRGLGLIHCTLQHFPVRKRLRVSVLKIEGLAGELRPELDIQPFCKVNILPGTKQKQLSVVKRGRDAVFNQEFFFDGISTEELDSKMLSIEVFHQSAQKLQKDSEIGEIFVPLKDLTQLYSKKEVRIVEELKYSVSNKKLGKIHLTTSIEKEARRLTINLIKVDDLPKWGIIGAPDVCVRITLSQGNSQSQTKSSRILKSTTNAVYKEAVMFLISTSKADLQHTKITISVHDLSRTVTGDDVIGSVYMGELAMDKSEIDQWKNTVEHWGKEYKGCHHLKINRQKAPDVHVSETQSDGEDYNVD